MLALRSVKPFITPVISTAIRPAVPAISAIVRPNSSYPIPAYAHLTSSFTASKAIPCTTHIDMAKAKERLQTALDTIQATFKRQGFGCDHIIREDQKITIIYSGDSGLSNFFQAIFNAIRTQLPSGVMVEESLHPTPIVGREIPSTNDFSIHLSLV